MQDGDTEETVSCSVIPPIHELEISWLKLSPGIAESFGGGGACLYNTTELEGNDTITNITVDNTLLESQVVVADGNILNFTTVSFGDEGYYICVVRRMFSAVCYSEAINMIGKATITQLSEASFSGHFFGHYRNLRPCVQKR